MAFAAGAVVTAGIVAADGTDGSHSRPLGNNPHKGAALFDDAENRQMDRLIVSGFDSGEGIRLLPVNPLFILIVPATVVEVHQSPAAVRQKKAALFPAVSRAEGGKELDAQQAEFLALLNIPRPNGGGQAVFGQRIGYRDNESVGREGIGNPDAVLQPLDLNGVQLHTLEFAAFGFLFVLFVELIAGKITDHNLGTQIQLQRILSQLVGLQIGGDAVPPVAGLKVFHRKEAGLHIRIQREVSPAADFDKTGRDALPALRVRRLSGVRDGRRRLILGPDAHRGQKQKQSQEQRGRTPQKS